jgi:hypothetical protein
VVSRNNVTKQAEHLAHQRLANCSCGVPNFLRQSSSGNLAGNGKHARTTCGVLLLTTFAKPSKNFINSLPSFFAFVSGLWLKTDAGPRDGENEKW